MKVMVKGGNLEEKEIEGYKAYLAEKFPNEVVDTLELTVDGDFVDMKYTFETAPFERIRRITGYLVGTVDRFNDGKRAEERDRVKHNVSCSCCG